MSTKSIGRNVTLAAAIASATLLASACGSGSSHSASYNAGHDSGAQGAARQSGAGGAHSHITVDHACTLAKDGAALAPQGAPNHINDFNSAEFIQGCMDAFKEHPVGS